MSVGRWLAEAAQRIDAALGPARVARVVLPPLRLYDRAGFVPEDSADSFSLALRPGDRLGMIGHFRPLIEPPCRLQQGRLDVTLTPRAYPGLEALLEKAG